MQRPNWRQRLGLAIGGFGKAAPSGRKASAASAAILQMGPYQAKWMQSDYETHAREGYLGNPYVYACIRQISMAIAGIPWQVFKDSSMKVKFDKHPLLDLLRKPNPLMSGQFFWENWVGYLLLDGNTYIERVPGNGEVVELYPLRPDRMRVVPGNQKQFVAGYVYRVGGYEVPFPSETILHTKLFNPLNDWYGASPIQAGSKSVDQSNQSKAWNVAMLQNGAAPTGALVAPGPVDDIQYNRLRELIEERYAGFMNAGRPLILEDGINWMEMGMSPKDMCWPDGQKMSAREIAMVFNIAPELVGDPDSKTFSNYGEARKALYEETVLPLMDKVKDDLNSWLEEPFGGAWIDIDRDQIEALHENLDAVYERNNAAFVSGWITINDARAAAKLDADKDAGPFYKWQLPVSNPPGIDPTQGPPAAGALVTEDGAKPKPLAYPDLPHNHPLNAGPPQLRLPPPPPIPGQTPPPGAPGAVPPAPAGKEPPPPAAKILIPAGRETKSIELKAAVPEHYIQQIERMRAPYERKVAREVTRILTPLHAAVASARSGRADGSALPSLLPALLRARREDLVTSLATLGGTIANKFGASTLDDLIERGAPDFDPDDVAYAAALNAYVQRYVGQWVPGYVDKVITAFGRATQKIVEAHTKHTRRVLRHRAVKDDGGDVGGEGDQTDINGELEDALSELADSLGESVVTMVSNLGPLGSAQAFADSAGIELTKVWGAVGDDHTRYTHTVADGQEQPLGTPFEVGESEMMFPMDGSMGADFGEIVGCRCVVYFTF